ncbi:MAG: hypothetical protein ABIF82_11280 [Planctomycetota bacterium]
MTGRKRRLVCIGAAAAVLLAAGTAGVVRLASREAAPRAGAWTALPDHGPRIERVVCVVNSARRAALRNAALVTKIVNALPPRVRVSILTNDRAAFTIARDPHPGRVELVTLPAESNFTIWPQDPFLVLTRPDGKKTLLASAAFERADDRVIPERLAAHLGWPRRASELSFEGGNIVCGSRHVFIGAETVRFNAMRLDVSDEEVVRKFQRELGRPVLVIGPMPQPVGHIDMILTALDSGRLALADPAWGARLARKELEEHPEAVAAFERACEELYFGDPQIRTLRGRGGKAIGPPKVAGRTSAAADASERIAHHLDRLAGELRRRGYSVHRVPFLFDRREAKPDVPATSPAAAGPEPAGKDETPKPDYPCLTYNNVLMETSDGERLVYLPQYGWVAMDKAAREAWAKIGCRAVGVKGLAISSMYGGSLRCCVKVLQRRRPAPAAR